MNLNKSNIISLLVVSALCASVARAQSSQSSPAGGAPLTAQQLDPLLAPIALYPDALVVQILQCATSPYQVTQVAEWLKKNPDLKGTAAQDAAATQGFDASFIAIVLFPQVVEMMAEKPDWTQQLGHAFTTDRDAVLESVQRLRKEAQNVGNLQSTPQQNVQTVKTDDGGTVIVIQPANPQVVYVPTYNPEVVYTQPAPQPAQSSSDNSGSVVGAALVGFTAGVIVGALADDDDHNYYYHYGGWGYARPVCYPGGYNDYYQHRENMANDWYDHRENMAGQRGENQGNRQENRSGDQAGRQENRSGNQTGRQDTRSTNQSTRQTNRGSTATRGSATGTTQRSTQSSGSGTGAFGGYQRGSTERASSSRGRSSQSRSGGGGGSRGGRRG